MMIEDLREEIRLKQEKISGDPGAFDARAERIRDELRSIGDVYSFWIENPELRKALLLGNKEPDTVKKMARKGIRNITDAWYFLCNHGQDKDFAKQIEPRILMGANAIVRGQKARQGKFRDREVTLNFKDYLPPKPGKINDLVVGAIDNVKDLCEGGEQLDAAIYAHLSLALIQPFDEGNKRTARLVQDRILVDAGLPPAIIPAGEAKFYLGLLGKAAPHYESGNARGQQVFYNYIASKVNNGLDTILRDLTVSEHMISREHD